MIFFFSYFQLSLNFQLNVAERQWNEKMDFYPKEMQDKVKEMNQLVEQLGTLSVQKRFEISDFANEVCRN